MKRKRGRPPKNSTPAPTNGRRKKKTSATVRAREEAILRHWAKAKVYPVERGKVQPPRATHAEIRDVASPEDEESQPKTYVIREMPTPVHTLTFSTLCRTVSQDIFLKTELMQGNHVIYVPAWEKYPALIEDEVAKESTAKTPVSPSRFRKRCRAVHKQRVEAQIETLHQLGNFADWDTALKNMDFRQEAKLIPLISRLREHRYLQDQAQLSPWCPKCIAPLDEASTGWVTAEMQHAYVKFPFSTGLESYGVDVFFCIQVPHLWEIVGTTELGITRDATYCLTQFAGEYLLFAKPHLASFQQRIPEGEAIPEIIEEISCDELAHSEVSHPLFPSKRLKIFTVSEEVSAYAAAMLKKGDFSDKFTLSTGVILLNPAHDALSYYIARKLGRTSSAVFDETGRFTEEAGTLCGLNLYAAEKLIVPQLERFGHLLKLPESAREESSPDETHERHCHRCQTLAVFRPSSQWKFSVAENQPTLELLNAQEYWNNYGATEHAAMAEVRKAATRLAALPVSGQRQWGMPLPILFCDECDEPLADRNALLAIRDSIRRGFDFWFRLSVEELLPTDTFCPNCNSEEFRKETTLIDSHFANLLQTINSSDFKKPPGGSISVAFLPQAGFAEWLAEVSVLCAALSRSRPIKESQPFKQLMLKEIPTETKRSRDFDVEAAFFTNYLPDVRRLVAITPGVKRTQWKTVAEEYVAEYQQLQTLLEKVAIRLKESGGYDFSIVTETREHWENSPRSAAILLTDALPKNKHRRIDALALAATGTRLQEVQQAYENGKFREMWRALVEFCETELELYLRLMQKRPSTVSAAALRTLSLITTAVLQRFAPLTPFSAEYNYSLCIATMPGGAANSASQTDGTAPNSIFLTPWIQLPPAHPATKMEWESLKHETP